MSIKFTIKPHGCSINLFHVVIFNKYPYAQLLISTAQHNGVNIYSFIEGNPFYLKINNLIKKTEDCPIYPSQIYDLLEENCAFEFDSISDILNSVKKISIKNIDFKIKTFFFVKNAIKFLKEIKNEKKHCTKKSS